MKIALPIWDAVREKWVVVDATLVNVAPHLTDTFAVHEAVTVTGRRGYWGVTHVETGTSVSGAYGYKNRGWALEAATNILAKKTNADVEERTRKMPERHR